MTSWCRSAQIESMPPALERRLAVYWMARLQRPGGSDCCWRLKRFRQADGVRGDGKSSRNSRGSLGSRCRSNRRLREALPKQRTYWCGRDGRFRNAIGAVRTSGSFRDRKCASFSAARPPYSADGELRLPDPSTQFVQLTQLGNEIGGRISNRGKTLLVKSHLRPQTTYSMGIAGINRRGHRSS